MTGLVIYITYPTEPEKKTDDKEKPTEPQERDHMTTFSGTGTTCRVVVNGRDYPCNVNVRQEVRNGTCKRIINGVEGPCD